MTTNVPITYDLTANQMSALALFFPRHTFAPGPGSLPHTHAVLATSRRLGEDYVLGLARSLTPAPRLIVDIGGNPCRHTKMRRNDVWSCCPILDQADAVRDKYRTATATRFCRHRVEACDCLAAKEPNNPVGPSIYVSIHSVYYLTPDAILRLCERASSGTLIALHHEFDQPHHQFACGEGVYDVADGQVKMSIIGNSVPYTHPDLTWMNPGYYSNGTQAIAWSEKTRIGEMTVTVFTLAPLGLAPNPVALSVLPLEQSLANLAHNGLVDFRGPLIPAKSHNDRFMHVFVNVTTLRSIGSVFVFEYDTRHSIVVPKQAVAVVRSKIMAMPFDKHMLDTSIFTAHSVLSKTIGLDAVAIADLTPYVAALAIQVHLIEMPRVMAPVNSLIGTARAAIYNAVITHTPLPTFRRWLRSKINTAIAASFVGVLLLLIKHRATRALRRNQFRFVFAGSFPTVYCLIAALGLMPFIIKSFSQRQRTSTIGMITKTHTIPDVCCDGVPLAAPHATAKLHVPILPACVAKHSTHAVGFHNPYVFPVLPRACAHNELIATHNRTIMDVPAPNNNVFSTYQQFCVDNNYFMHLVARKVVSPACTELPDPPAPNFHAWNSRFPTLQQQVHRDALHDNITMPRRELYHQSSTFVKRENTLKGTQYGITPFSPRAIQSRVPYYQARVGPTIWAFANHMKSVWNDEPMHVMGLNVILTYVSGRDANAACTPFIRFHEDHTVNVLIMVLGDDGVLAIRHNDGTLTYHEFDFSRFDAHVQRPHLLLNRARYVFMGAEPTVLALLKSELDTAGATRSGIKYSVEGKRRSGDPTTSEGNTFLNGSMLLFATIASGALTTPRNTSGILTILRDLGMKPTHIYHDSPHRVSFCSSYFLPAVRPDGSHTLVLTPKLGRVLSKSHFNFTDLPDSQWLHQVAYAQSFDFAHLPIYREIANVAYARTSGSVSGPTDYHNFHLHQRYGQSPLIYHYYQMIYDLDATTISQMAEDIQHAPALPCELTGHPVRRIVEVDTEPEYPIEPTPMFVGCLSTFMETVFVAPVVEEAIKRTWLAKPFIYLELLASVYHFRDSPAKVAARIIVAAAHHLTLPMPYAMAVVCHTAWNAIACLHGASQSLIR